MNVTVYCGSNPGKNPHFAKAAEELGEWLAAEGHALVYGGSSVGLMGIVSRAVLDAGNPVYGVEPRFFIDAGVAQHDLTRLYVVETMGERKAKMIELGEVFVALPGGVGTLEEISEIMSRIRLGLGPAECFLLNVDGFYDPLKALVRAFLAEGFVAEADLERFRFPETVADLARLVAESQAHPTKRLVTAAELGPDGDPAAKAPQRREDGAPASPRLVVLAAETASLERAERIAKKLGAPLVRDEAEARTAGLAVRVDAAGLALEGDGMVLRQDFGSMVPRLRAGNLQRELLVRAAKVKGARSAGPSHGTATDAAGADAVRPTAVDATAGLGEDAVLLAAAGFRVKLFERNPVIALLLQDALRRAAEDPALAEVAARMELVEGDSVEALRGLADAPDVVYLDPMFPERTKSAAVKKKFQLLHRLERPCEDQETLLQAALAARPRKVVVKRPAKGPCLAGVKPSYSISGKAVRYDCIVPPRAF